MQRGYGCVSEQYSNSFATTIHRFSPVSWGCSIMLNHDHSTLSSMKYYKAAKQTWARDLKNAVTSLCFMQTEYFPPVSCNKHSGG